MKDANKDIRVELTESLSFLPVWLHSECSFPLSSHASRFLFEIFIQTFNYRSFPYKNTFLMKAANLSTFSCFPSYFSYTVHPGFYDSYVKWESRHCSSDYPKSRWHRGSGIVRVADFLDSCVKWESGCKDIILIGNLAKFHLPILWNKVILFVKKYEV